MNFIQRQSHKLDSILKTYVFKDSNTIKWEKLHNKLAGERVLYVERAVKLGSEILYVYRPTCGIHSSFISEKNANVYWMTEINPIRFRYKLPLISRGSQTVAIAAIQNYTTHDTAKEIKGRRIESQNDDDPNHFDPRYFGKGRKYHQPDKWATDRMMEGFRQAKINADKDGVKIANAGIGGMLEVFPRVEFESLLGYSEQEKMQLLSLCIGENINISKLQDLIDDPNNSI
eukprot:gene2746-3737_t